MRRSLFVFLYLLISAPSFAQFAREEKDRVLVITDFGIEADGQSDHTEQIQRVIDNAREGETVYIPSGTFLVRTLRLKSGVNLLSDGLLKHHPSAKTGEFSFEKQNSPNPLILGMEVSDIQLSLNSQSINEAIVLNRSQKITIYRSTLLGDNTKLRSYPGISIFQCSEISILSSKISGFGMPRLDSKTYQPGTGIRIMTSNTVAVRDSEIFENGENGIFIHGSRKIEAVNNVIHHNGMSGIQIAFGNSGKEADYRIAGNIMDQNAADALDINNRSLQNSKDINCVIYANTSCYNGFVNGQSTPDGSGIATLINVSNVLVFKNVAVNNNRPAIYVESCDLILVKENQADNQVELVLDLGEISLDANQFSSVNLMANVKAEKLSLKNNQLTNLSLPNGISVRDFLIENNTISHASLNFNLLAGQVTLLRNKIKSEHPVGAILLVQVSKALLEENDIMSEKGIAVTIRKSAKSVALIRNRIKSVSACVMEDGSEKLLLKENILTAMNNGSADSYTILSKDPRNLTLKSNEHHGIEGQVAVLMVGSGTASIQDERIRSGTFHYGNVQVKN